MARGVPHSDETRSAVLAALLAGQSVTKVAEEFRLSHTTVIAWRDAAGLGSTHVEPEKRADLGGLIADYLRETLTTLSVQARAFRNEAWLAEQPASEVAVLHGVLTDKAIRILSALEPGAEPAEPGGAGGGP